jgi:hypothetical protein
MVGIRKNFLQKKIQSLFLLLLSTYATYATYALAPSRKWFATHPEVLSAYHSWLKWNLTKTGRKPHCYKGDLVRKLSEEAGAALK